MAAVDNVTVNEVIKGLELVRAQLTGATSTYVSQKFSSVQGFKFSVEGTNSCTATRSGTTITFTGTNDDWVNFQIWGQR